MSEEINPEQLFLRYAFPCLALKVDRKEITEEVAKSLEDALANNLPINRKLLETTFGTAYAEIKKMVEGGNPWDNKVIKNYFLKRHNTLVERKYAHPEQSDLCKVHEAEVVAVGDGCATVVYNSGKRRTVQSKLVGGLTPGDIVAIHYGYAVDIIG